jgi:hypothetical protein
MQIYKSGMRKALDGIDAGSPKVMRHEWRRSISDYQMKHKNNNH